MQRDAAQPCGRVRIGGRSTRRSFLKSVGALSATAALPSVGIGAPDSPTVAPQLIDVHHHLFPPFLQARWSKDHVRVVPAAMQWTIDATLEAMAEAGVGTAILSLPGGTLPLPRSSLDEHRRMARMVNDYAAMTRRDHPGRFGFFACLPMPDLDGTLAEIDYALGRLGADGVSLSTSYGDRFLGDPDYRPVMDELERRKAVVFVHPNRCRCCEPPDTRVSDIQDSIRTVMSLLFSGTLTRTRGVRWIFPHTATTVSLLAERVEALAKIRFDNQAQVLPDGIDAELERLHYETANAPASLVMPARGTGVTPAQLLFGSSFPFVPIADSAGRLLRDGLSESDRRAVARDNALRLMPHLAP